MKKINLLVMVVLTIVVISGCKKTEGDKPVKNKKGKPGENVETIFAVNTTKAIKGEIKNYIELNGDVKAKNEVDVYPDANGKIASFTVKLGQSVSKNQIVAYIDPSRPGTEFKLSPVKSTISGVVTSLPVKVGATVNLQTSIAKVGKLNEIEIATYISEKFINKIKIGLIAVIKSEAFPAESFKAITTEVSPVVDPATRMMEVKLALTDNEIKLKPGMFAEIKIVTEAKNNIVKIPSECVIKRYGDFYVFTINRTNDDEATVDLRKVKTGIQIDDKIEIEEGLQIDEEVVVSGQSLLEDKSKVRIINTIQPLTKEDVIQ